MVNFYISLELCAIVGVLWVFFTFPLNAPMLFGLTKIVVGVDLSNFLSNQCLVSEMSFVGKSQKDT